MQCEDHRLADGVTVASVWLGLRADSRRLTLRRAQAGQTDAVVREAELAVNV